FVMERHSKGFNIDKIVDSLYLKDLQLRTNFPDLFPVIPLFLDHDSVHKYNERLAGTSVHRHDPVIIMDYKNSSNKIINRNDNSRKPTDGIAAHRSDISIEAVKNISIRILIQSQPVRIYDLVKNIRLNIIININAQLGRDPA